MRTCGAISGHTPTRPPPREDDDGRAGVPGTPKAPLARVVTYPDHRPDVSCRCAPWRGPPAGEGGAATQAIRRARDCRRGASHRRGLLAGGDDEPHLRVVNHHQPQGRVNHMRKFIAVGVLTAALLGPTTASAHRSNTWTWSPGAAEASIEDRYANIAAVRCRGRGKRWSGGEYAHFTCISWLTDRLGRDVDILHVLGRKRFTLQGIS